MEKKLISNIPKKANNEDPDAGQNTNVGLQYVQQLNEEIKQHLDGAENSL